MKFIDRKVHAVLDYIMGIVLIASPCLFGFSDHELAKWPPIVIGIIMLFTSLVTDYEGGVVKKLSMGKHLNMDAIAGILLAASPWLVGFYEHVYLPHLVLGMLEISAAMFTYNISQHTAAPQIHHT